MPKHYFKVELHRKTIDRNSGEWVEGTKIVHSPIQPMPELRIDLGEDSVCFRCHDVTYKADQDLWVVTTPGSFGMYTAIDLVNRAKELEQDGWEVRCCPTIEQVRTGPFGNAGLHEQ